jgi:hypothetical protein
MCISWFLLNISYLKMQGKYNVKLNDTHLYTEVKDVAVMLKIIGATIHNLVTWNLCTPALEKWARLISSPLRVTVRTVKQGCSNPGHQVTTVTAFCRVAPNILGPQYGTCFMSLFWCLKF